MPPYQVVTSVATKAGRLNLRPAKINLLEFSDDFLLLKNPNETTAMK